MNIDEVVRDIDERRDGRGRRVMLTNDERTALRDNQTIEAAVALYLNLEEAKNQSEIAEELGISVRQLKYMTQTEEFKTIYNEHFSELGHDPRLKATKAGLVDLLPLAFTRLTGILRSTDTPATVLMKAIDRVLELNGIQPQEAKVSDRKELAEFLGHAGLQMTQNNFFLNPPDDYQEALTDVEGGVVIGEATEVPIETEQS
jgi:hypothetical protein